MKKRLNLNKFKSYFKELSIITISVLLALIISNIKESRQAKKYHRASIETIRSEVQQNHESLKHTVDLHLKMLDTIHKYENSPVTIEEIVQKAHGLQGMTVTNTGLEFYKRNKINDIDFEIMSVLLNIESATMMIDTKMSKLVDFLYPNIYNDAKESKRMFFNYLSNVLNSEQWLLEEYEDFLKEE